jgi:hypothetical protein
MNISDYLHDIAIGITGIQTIDNGRYTTLKQTGRIKAIPKTDILDHIHSIVEPALNQIHKDFSWQYEYNFMTSEGHVNIIEYKHYGDACIIEMDSNRMKINKKYLKELYSKKVD